MAQGTGEENEATNVKFFLSRWATYEGRVDTYLSSHSISDLDGLAGSSCNIAEGAMNREAE